jgi:hypothetical protein
MPTTASAAPVTVSHYIVQAVTVNQNMGSLESSASSGNQWYEVGTGLIPGATGSSYTPTVNGDYYTVVTDLNGCSVTSNVYNMLSVGLSENGNQSGIALYPNPTDGLLTLRFDQQLSTTVLRIENLLGQILLDEAIEPAAHSSKTIDMSAFEHGIYYVVIRSESLNVRWKVVLD